MKIPLAAKAVSPLLLSLAALASAQTPAPAPPPVKMGLWLEQVTTTITGIEGVTPTPHKDVEQSCISPESWKHGLQAMNANRCETSNLHQDSHKMSYDERCGSPAHGFIVFHMNILIDNDQHMHGTAIAKMQPSAASHQATWNSTLTDRYLGPDCGDIKPGEKKPLKQ
jgi:hypothetical protein